jgi:hypothetical protein
VQYAQGVIRSPKYPLAALASLREREVERASTDLAGKAQKKRAAEAARADAEARRDNHERRSRAVRDAERGALESGQSSAGDLAREHAWATRAAAEARTLLSRVEAAATEVQRAGEAHRGAQSRLATRNAEAKVVLEHRARWDEACAEKVEAAEEEAAFEAWRPKR